jgi:hypothetical protein
VGIPAIETAGRHDGKLLGRFGSGQGLQIVANEHQRMGDAGIKVSRPWLTQLMQSTVALLEPIHDA